MKEITENQYALLQPYLPVQRGNVRVSNLNVINAILFVAANGGLYCRVLANGTRFSVGGAKRAFWIGCLRPFNIGRRFIGKVLSPTRRHLVDQVCDALDVSERRACSIIKQPRSTQRREPIVRDDEDALTRDIIALASEYGRYGYHRITALLRAKGWHVNHKRVMRIWRRWPGVRIALQSLGFVGWPRHQYGLLVGDCQNKHPIQRH